MGGAASAAQGGNGGGLGQGNCLYLGLTIWTSIRPFHTLPRLPGLQVRPASRPPPRCGGGRRDLWPSTAFSVLTGPLTTFPGPVAEDEEGQAGLSSRFWGQEEEREAWIEPEGTLGLLSRLGCWAALCQVVSMTRWQVPHHCPPPLAASFRSSHRLLGPLESPAPSQDSEDS